MSVVEINGETTRTGGVTGVGFRPGVSGNPGGRPKGVRRRVQELVGPDADAIIGFMVAVMTDDRERTRDRLESAKWLADRGFGRAAPAADSELESGRTKLDLSKLSDDELNLLIELTRKAQPDEM